MYDNTRNEIVKWLTLFTPSLVADLGALNINGSVSELYHQVIGFDIVAGRGVDVVVEEGVVPKRWHGTFDMVIATSSFQFAPSTEKFKQEILDLLAPKGRVLLTACAPSCACHHTSSPTTKDERRWWPEQFVEWLAPEVKAWAWRIEGFGHEDVIVVGRRT